jgi:very-short-patch-repair endonuclease
MKKENKTLDHTHPELCKEWDYEKNYPLTPKDVNSGSSKKVHWVCKKFVEDKWEMSPGVRTVQNQNCPYCSHRKVNLRTCLSTTHPDIIKQWHITLNGDITPTDVSYGSKKKYWWQCPDYAEDIYETSINNKTKDTNCPFCSGKKANIRNCLATNFSDIAKEWHPILNGKITPYDITYGSGKEFWFLCTNNHKYKTRITSRTSINKTGCPHCQNKNETIIYNFLLENNFNFKEKFNIPRLLEDQKRDSKIDFYLLDYNLFIEYDGIQHFEPVDYFGGENKFKKQIARDQSLSKYCKENKINILRIDGRKYQGKNLEDFLNSNFLNALKEYV